MYRLDLSRYSARFDPHNISSKNNSSISSFINIPSNKNKQGDSEIEIERYPRTSKNKIKHIIKNFKHTRLRIWKIWKALRPSGGRVPPAATCGRSPASPPHGRHGEAASHPTAPVERSTSRPYPRVPPWEGGVHPATAAVRRDRLLAQTLTPSPPPSPAAAWLDAEREWGKREENGGRGGGERDGEWSSGGDRATVPKFLVKGRLQLSRRTFTVAAAQMLRLKQRIVVAGAGGLTPPSGFVALAALAWVSFVRSKHAAGAIAAGDEVYLFFFIDCRGRRAAFDPPVGEGFFGTCISGCLATATARDLLGGGDGGLVAAARAVQEEVRRAAEDPLAGWEWMSLVGRIALSRLVNMSGSTRFPAYEAADFGWGSPSRTELVTMNHGGQVVLVAAKGGGVQASVSMKPEHMDKFKSDFESYLE
ncbi:hypothetical protein OsJ_26219 [Oryza sativa Japonica Group]|uniref:Uncharacterized protein n=1 Tax=Oryza sativa subsp. japonica TaxID=39947 RepID=B9FZB2_ORYSJ|nr:hypothetical protein OsJ_26219 [Oryza sativa Japonica Group]